MSRPLLALTLICRDEAASVRATLETVRGVVDHCTVYDTGSSDGTRTVLTKTAVEMGLTATVHEGPFVDYSTARNRAFALEVARSTPARWALTLSVDEKIDGGDVLRRFLENYDGEETAFNIELRSEGATCIAPRITKVGGPWQYEGVVHEQLVNRPARRDGTSLGTIMGVSIEHRATDPLRRYKRMREFDLPALLRTVEDASVDLPRRLQCATYLAQTYEALVSDPSVNEVARRMHLGSALALYAWRATSGGDAGEVNFALFHYVVVADQLGIYDDAEIVKRLRGLMERDPKRPEVRLMLAAKVATADPKRGVGLAVEAAGVAARAVREPNQYPVNPACEWQSWRLVAECARALGDVNRMRESAQRGLEAGGPKEAFLSYLGARS